MNSPICVSKICITNRKQTASFRMAGWMLTIAPLWLMLAAAGTSVQAQTTPSSADWTQFHRDNMQRWNPYETVLGVGNVNSLLVKWSVSASGTPSVVNGVIYVPSKRQQPVRTERQQWRSVVELCHWRFGYILPCSGKWRGLCGLK